MAKGSTSQGRVAETEPELNQLERMGTSYLYCQGIKVLLLPNGDSSPIMKTRVKVNGICDPNWHDEAMHAKPGWQCCYLHSSLIPKKGCLPLDMDRYPTHRI